MKFSQFIDEIQDRLEIDSMGEAVRVTRVTLTTLGERIQPAEAKDLAGPLPMEIDTYLLEADSGERFSFDEFLTRVSDGADVDQEIALSYAQEIITLLYETVPGNEMQQIRGQLPDDFDPLFELADGETTTK